MSPTDKNSSNKNTVKQSLSKGCGCFSVFFMIFFVWGIWTTITTYSSVEEVNATVVQSIQIEKTDLSAKPSNIYIPIVSYEYQGIKYLDTLDYKANNTDIFEIGSSIKTYVNPENPKIAMDNSTDAFYFYTIFLIMAILSFMMYKILKKAKKHNQISHKKNSLK